MAKPFSSRVVAGLLVSAVLIVLDLVLLHYPGVPDSTRYLCRMAISFTAILVLCLRYAQLNYGTVRFGDVFSYGLRTTAILAFMLALYSFIYYRLIHPHPAAAEMDAAIKAIEQQGNALHEEARREAENAAANRWIIYVSLAIFSTLIPGLLGALGGAASTRKKP